LQASWRIGLVGPKHRARIVKVLAARFEGCAGEKNCTLTRHDIVQCLRLLHDAVDDPPLRQIAVTLIATEPDPKYRRKYETVWK
jgi:hypothetical protein